ncbi:hypothetical protein JJQ72_10755 [Paenibacillus sp. F411]|uniref:hypothetical protein n=1 Tax=Paenibacillus sp. F411 TaxID=2820239 RepID=UPI001AAFE7F4|nr:hypothetical protein [Paenibacillus sp. F411]MBO2944449.1 hypothetical protein [Paenibacillus sp. F411]
MSNESKDYQEHNYSEFISINNEGNKFFDKNKSKVTWHEEKNKFSSMYEAQEYVSSEVYPEILQSSNGYKTTDPKLAFSLLFELTKIKTHGILNKEIHADIEVIDEQIYYLVWTSNE